MGNHYARNAFWELYGGANLAIPFSPYNREPLISFFRRFTLTAIRNVERKNGDQKGYRYLLNVQLRDMRENKTINLSEYVFRKLNTPELCYPEGLQWKRNVPVNFVVTAKNQTAWLRAFIDNMANIYQQTRDANIRVVILEYEGGDVHLEEALEKSGLPHYKVLRIAGSYSRTVSFNVAMKAVDDPHSIVFLVDLHIEMTSAVLNDIRMVSSVNFRSLRRRIIIQALVQYLYMVLCGPLRAQCILGVVRRR